MSTFGWDIHHHHHHHVLIYCFFSLCSAPIFVSFPALSVTSPLVKLSFKQIPISEGGSLNRSGQPTKARDFEDVGGPEDKEVLDRQNRGGDDDVVGNVR